MANAWDHLPNAKLVDRVLADLRARPQVWAAAWDASPWDAARGAARVAAWGASRDATWAAAWDATWAATWAVAWDAARDACAALVAWDDASLLLDMPVDAVRLLAASGHHPAVLMLPACIALNGDSHD
jgi:hypothetical protein